MENSEKLYKNDLLDIDFSENYATISTGGVNMEISIYQEINANESNIIKLVEAIFSRALQLGASDIHIEPLEIQTRVRVRLDGLLTELCSFPIAKHNAVLSRIKLISDMDIAEKRIPQDGRFTASFQNKNIDFRMSSLPTINGEKLAIRILDNSISLLTLDKLGFSNKNDEFYRKLIHMPNGLVLITGPTGSGKTTTLYATLNEINNKEKNIVTIEDPVEYKLPGINQVTINQKQGLDFNTALKALVRQDPNVIMIGEIRDKESANVAIQSALTGHLVLSTLHTNSALGAVNRLIDMGIEPFLLVASLRGVVAQRLVRRICPKCKRKYYPDNLERSCFFRLKHREEEISEGSGCDYCKYLGYKGRIALHELLVMDDKLAGMIISGEEISRQEEYLRSQGLHSLAEDGLAKILQQETTFKELLRISLV